MFGRGSSRRPERLGFLLVADFSMIAFTSAVEPLRMANRLSGRELYAWRTLSVDGAPVRASNGIAVVPDSRLAAAAGESPVVCAGIGAGRRGDRRIDAWLHAMAGRGATLGAVCTGPLFLARAGLLDGYRCTIHWEDMVAFAEEFPGHHIAPTLFEIDRDRFTCAGGTAALDMMVHCIGADHGQDLAVAVADEMIHAFMRRPRDPQRASLRHRTGICHPGLLAAIARMESSLEAPVPTAALAAGAGLTLRQLERLFRDHLGTTPSRHYLGLRLERARLLLDRTALPVMEVAVASGFVSASHFSRCYRAAFGRAPRDERRRRTRGGAAPGSRPPAGGEAPATAAPGAAGSAVPVRQRSGRGARPARRGVR